MRTMFILKKEIVEADNLNKETFIMAKVLRYSFVRAELEKKVRAYLHLIQSNFGLHRDDNDWKFIDENPEYYEDIRGKISQSVLQLLNNETDVSQQVN